jgi:beta-RFAP synthase
VKALHGGTQRASVKRVVVTTAARLHFGMFSFGQEGVRQFGGVGVMVAPPSVRMVIEESPQMGVSGPGSDRAGSCLERIRALLRAESPPNCRVTIEQMIEPHVGLGSGTATALAICAGVRCLMGRSIDPADALARLAGRARRSAVGTHGFLRGGLIAEGGKVQPEEISPLVARVELPAQWRFVLVRPRGVFGLHGAAEVRALERLPPVPLKTTDQLCRIATDELLPAAESGAFDRFSDAVFRFNQLAGSCFAPAQGGTFDPRLARLIAQLRSHGVVGVGQSSWGPTVFALAQNVTDAEALRNEVHTWDAALGVTIAATVNQGAAIETS